MRSKIIKTLTFGSIQLIDKKRNMRAIIRCNYIIITIFLFISCNEDRKLTHNIAQMKSQPIDLCLDSLQYYISTTNCSVEIDSSSFYRKNTSIVVYTDSSVCSSCTVKGMYKWFDFLDEIEERYGGDMKIYFIFSPRKSQMNDFQIALHSLNLNYPVFIDSTNIFIRHNPHIPSNKRLHTFLINTDNMVYLVGSPLENLTIHELFHKTASNLLQRK